MSMTLPPKPLMAMIRRVLVVPLYEDARVILEWIAPDRNEVKPLSSLILDCFLASPTMQVSAN